MSKYKVGDMVRYISHQGFGDDVSYFEIGKAYLVKSVDTKGLRVNIPVISHSGYLTFEQIELAVPNNPLSRIVYPKLVPTECGKYLTNPEE